MIRGTKPVTPKHKESHIVPAKARNDGFCQVHPIQHD